MKKQRNKTSILPEPEFYGTAVVGIKGQIVIPIEARTKYKIKNGDKLIIFGGSNGVLAILKADELNQLLERLSPKLKK